MRLLLRQSRAQFRQCAGNMSARIVTLLPDQTFLESDKPSSRTCTTVEEIQLAVEAAAEVKAGCFE